MEISQIIKIRNELSGLKAKELEGVKNILEFNLRGIFVGDRQETIEKLTLVQLEIAKRKNAPKGS